MKKKLFAIIIAVVACLAAAFTLAGCGDDSTSGSRSAGAYWSNVAASAVVDTYSVEVEGFKYDEYTERFYYYENQDDEHSISNYVYVQDGDMKGVIGKSNGKYNGYVNAKARYTHTLTENDDDPVETSGVIFDLSACMTNNELYVFMGGLDSYVMKQNVFNTLPDFVFECVDAVLDPDGVLHKLMRGKEAREINTYIKGLFEKFCKVTTDGSTRTITFDPDMLYAFNDELGETPANKILDEMFGEGFYDGLDEKADELLSMTVGEFKTELIKSGVTKAELYDLVANILKVFVIDSDDIDIDALLDTPLIGSEPLKDTKIIDVIAGLTKKSAADISEMVDGALSEYSELTVYEIIQTLSGTKKDLHAVTKAFLDEYIEDFKNTCELSATTDASGNIKSIVIKADDFTVIDEDHKVSDTYRSIGKIKVSGTITLKPNSGNPVSDKSAIDKVRQEMGVFDKNATISVECGDCSYELHTDKYGVVSSIDLHAEIDDTYPSEQHLYEDRDGDGEDEMYVRKTERTYTVDWEYDYADGAVLQYNPITVPDGVTGDWYYLSLDLESLAANKQENTSIPYVDTIKTYLVTDPNKYTSYSHDESLLKLVQTETDKGTASKTGFDIGYDYITKGGISLFYNATDEVWTNSYPDN